MMGSRAWITNLLGSHLVAALVGVAIGHGLDVRYGAGITPVKQAIGQTLASDATTLAFRYGSAEHARAIVSAAPTYDSDDKFRWGNRLVRDLRLVIICRDQSELKCEHEFWTSAIADCKQLGWSKCSAEGLKQLADKIAAERTPSGISSPPSNNGL